MKRLFLLLILVFSLIVNAQVPAGFNYQSVVRNSAGEIVANQTVKFKFSVLQNSVTGTPVYVETQSAITNDFGLVNLTIGKGEVLSGVLDSGGWGPNKHFMKVEIDPIGGNSFIHMGTTQLMAVPYAFHAQTVEEDNVNDADADPTNEIQDLQLSGTVLGLSGSSKTVNLPSTGGSDNWGTQAVESDATLDGNGTSGSHLKIAQQGATSGQVLKWTGSTWQPGDIPEATSLWQQNGSDIYYTTGRVGIGTTAPNLDFTVKKTGHAQVNIQGTSDALIHLDKGATSRYSGVAFKDNGSDKFWMGLLQNDNFRISTRNDAFDGLEITSTGNVNFSSSQNVSGSVTVGGNQSVGGNIAVNGKIGIGKTPSAFSLEILGGSHSYAKLYHSVSGTGTKDGFLVGTESSNTCWLWNYENGHMRLGTNNADRMIITSTGRVGIGNTNPSFKLDVTGQLNLNKGIKEDQALYVNGSEALWYNGTYFSWGYGGTYNYFADRVTIKTSVNPGYDLVVSGSAAKAGGGNWSTLSDARLKNILCDYNKGLNEIIALQPVRFTYKEDNPRQLSSNEEQIGFIAQDVQKIFPEAVNECNDGYLDFNMHTVNVALVNAVKELKAENEKLKIRLEKLENIVEMSAQNVK